MAIILKRIQELLQPSLDDCSHFSLDSVGPLSAPLITRLNEGRMKSTKSAVFTLLVEEDSSLVIEYDALRALLKNVLDTSPDHNNDKTAQEEKATLLVYELLALAELQVYKYDHYINDHPDLTTSTLKKHQLIYEAWLNHAPYVAAETVTVDGWNTQNTNPIRLYLVRGRRFLFLLSHILKNYYNYTSWFIWADAYVATFLAWVGFLFFLPRLIYDLGMLYGIPGFESDFNYPKMQQDEILLNSSARFNAQWYRLWPNLVNDVAWLASGIFLCFVLIGAKLPLAIFLSVVMQFYDVIMVSIRAHYELSSLDRLMKEHRNILSDSNREYMACLEKNIQRERSLLALAFGNALVLFCGIGLALPVVAALHPLLPLIGAGIVICMTVIFFEGGEFFSVFKRQYDTNDLDKQLGAAYEEAAGKPARIIARESEQITASLNRIGLFQVVQESAAPRTHDGQQQNSSP